MKTKLFLLVASVMLALSPVTASAGDAPAPGTAHLEFSWDYNHTTNPATEFRIYELTAPNTWTVVHTVTGTTAGAPAPNAARLENVKAGARTYAIAAVGPWGESPHSAPVTTPAPAATPANPRVQIVVQVTVNVP